MMGVLLWIITIGFVAGVIARLLMPSPNTPKFGRRRDFAGLYRTGQGAGLIGQPLARW